jgi:hypothetical protein
MTFEQWWEKQTRCTALDAGDRLIAEAAWQAAQEAERERITVIMVKQYRDNYTKSNEAIKTALRAINE